MAHYFAHLFWLSDTTASLLGIFLNILLLAAIWSTNKGKFSQYTYLVLVSCVNDLVFSAYQVCIQHAIKVDKGIIYVFPSGFERYLPPSLLCVTAFFHLFTIANTFTTQPAIYHYRYLLVTQISKSDLTSVLIRNLTISVLTASVVGIAFAWSTHQTVYRGRDYYIHTLSSIWVRPDGTSDFLYAANWNDLTTKIYFYVVTTVFTATYMLSFYYIWISMKSVNVEARVVSETTKRLRSQFTKTLLSQTAVLTAFGCLPCSIYMMALFLGVGGDFLGLAMMGPVSWFPVLNALLPMFFVRAFRAFLLSLLGVRAARERIAPTSTASSDAQLVK